MEGRVRVVAAPSSVRCFTRPSCGRALPRCCPGRPELWEVALGTLRRSSGVLPGSPVLLPGGPRLLPRPSCTLYFCRRRRACTRCRVSRDCLQVSWKLAAHLLIEASHRRFPLRVVPPHCFVLRQSDRGNRLILGCATRNLFLNGLAHIHEHLPETAKPLSGFSRVCRNRSMCRHENVGAERFNRIQCANPVETVPVDDDQELIGKIH